MRLIVSPILLALPCAVSFQSQPTPRLKSLHLLDTLNQGRGGLLRSLSSSSTSTSLSSTISANQDLLPGIAAISNANGEIYENLESLRDSSFFRMYCVDILASCEYMPQELFECYSETCEVYPLDDDEVGFNIDLF